MNIFDEIKGLKPVDPVELAEYEREMRQEAIPAMIEEVEMRQRLAHEYRMGLIA